jgi:hypothetical protein
MNKIKTYENSLVPIWQKDIDFMQDGIREALAALCTSLGLGRDHYIISGCAISDNGQNIMMQSGWAYWNGDILPVRALPTTAHASGSPKIKLTRVTAYDAEGVKTITTGNIVTNSDTYQCDYLQPSLVATGETYDLAIEEGFWDMATRIMNRSMLVDSGVTEISGSGVNYRRIGGTVQLLGTLFNDALTGFSGQVLSGLPRPASDLRLPTMPEATGSYMMLTTAGSCLFIQALTASISTTCAT